MKACDTTPGAKATRRSGQPRWLALVLLLVTGAVLSSGCITLRLTNEFAVDGSGSKRLVFALDSDLMELAASAAGELGESRPGPGQQPNPDDLFAELRRQASNAPGAQVSEYNDPVAKRRGVEVVVPFGDFQEFMALGESELFSDLERPQLSTSGQTVTFRSQFSPKAADTSGQMSSDELGQQFTNVLAEKMGFDLAYGVVVPGAVVDWGPRDFGTSETRPDGSTQITWQGDLTTSWSELWVTWVAP